MKDTKLFLFLLLPFFLFSQEKEKRQALVIGNANYDKGELKNPVNDARLIASTLDSLDFDVILKENLSTKRDMTAVIREFGSRRSAYDVAFVYYAGHGIQVDDEITHRFMSEFYTNLVQTKNINLSLRNTKLKIKSIYPDPLYWAPFVLIQNKV